MLIMAAEAFLTVVAVPVWGSATGAVWGMGGAGWDRAYVDIGGGLGIGGGWGSGAFADGTSDGCTGVVVETTASSAVRQEAAAGLVVFNYNFHNNDR